MTEQYKTNFVLLRETKGDNSMRLFITKGQSDGYVTLARIFKQYDFENKFSDTDWNGDVWLSEPIFPNEWTTEELTGIIKELMSSGFTVCMRKG